MSSTPSDFHGTTSTAQKAADGEYTITIDAKDTAGATMTATTKISGVVDGVDFTGSIPTLKIGAISVPIDKVKFVNEPVSLTSAANTGSTTKQTTTGAAPAATASKPNPWYPDHAVFSATKDELKAMPEFKYSTD